MKSGEGKPTTSAKPPKSDDLTKLTVAAKRCRVCPFARKSTQTVFGEGSSGARVMLVGEQPGDQEDRAGHPFVGPAGKLLDTILAELKIPRADIFVTNAVKHFKFQRRGKFRLHAKPNASEAAACRPWLESEIRAVHPEIIVALGATAAYSLCGGKSIGSNRGKVQALRAEFHSTTKVLFTWHPSAILRAPEEKLRHQKRAELKEDLRRAWQLAKVKPK